MKVEGGSCVCRWDTREDTRRTRDEGRRRLRYAASDVEEGRMELEKHSNSREFSKLSSHVLIGERKAKSREEEKVS
jgi:hypothetical protein